MKSIKLQGSAAILALLAFATPSKAQPFTWRDGFNTTAYRPSECLLSMRERREYEWTRGQCYEIAFTESNQSINIHFKIHSQKSGHAIITFALPAKNRGQRVMPVVAIGLNTNGNRVAVGTVGGFSGGTNRCELKWPTITCSAIAEEGGKTWGFVASASLD